MDIYNKGKRWHKQVNKTNWTDKNKEYIYEEKEAEIINNKIGFKGYLR